MASRLTFAALAVSAIALGACASDPGPAGGRHGRGGPGGEQGVAYRSSTFLSGAALLFVQFDTDHNFVTTRAEAEAGAKAEWARAQHSPTGMTPIQFETWAATVLGGPNIGPYRLAFDTNVNNEVTEEEFVAAILAKFDKYDANKDGAVTRAEMVERLPERMGGPMGPGGPVERAGAPGEGPPGGRPR